MPPTTLTLDGDNIHDIPSFYDEINRVFMSDEDWELGPSLDALDDMLYGGYGALQAGAVVELVWLNIDKSRQALGLAATRGYYLEKLKRPDLFNSARFQKSLDELDKGKGPTYFEIVLEIFAAHPNIRLKT